MAREEKVTRFAALQKRELYYSFFLFCSSRESYASVFTLWGINDTQLIWESNSAEARSLSWHREREREFEIWCCQNDGKFLFFCLFHFLTCHIHEKGWSSESRVHEQQKHKYKFQKRTILLLKPTFSPCVILSPMLANFSFQHCWSLLTHYLIASASKCQFLTVYVSSWKVNVFTAR